MRIRPENKALATFGFSNPIVIVIYTYWTSPSDDRGWNAFGTTLQTYLTPLSGFNGMIYLSKTSRKHGLD